MIWIVTNSDNTRKGLLTLVSGIGYPVHFHDCAEDVLAQMKFARPRLLIVDCSLPDAYTLIESIRDDYQVAGTSVIVFSAGDESDREKALAHGADAFVAKGALDWGQLRPEIFRFAGPLPLR